MVLRPLKCDRRLFLEDLTNISAGGSPNLHEVNFCLGRGGGKAFPHFVFHAGS